MSDLFLVEQIDVHRLLCASELSDETLSDQIGLDRASDAGIYLYVVDERLETGGITVLARVTSTDSAFELFELFAGHHRKSFNRVAANKPSQRRLHKRCAG